jgi:hypothetical protein
LHRSFHHSKEISYYRDSNLIEKYHIDYRGNGYFHEIMEVTNCLNKGEIESKKLPHSFSLDLIKSLDRIREKIDLSYDE